MEKRKSSTIIKDEGAYELIEGIENMELFLTRYIYIENIC